MKTKKLKGSVLFTVIAVMMVVLVFVMSALTIAGATNRRAYSDYSKAQAQYTARAALDATMASLRDYIVTYDPVTGAVKERKNNALGKAVAGLSKSSTPIELDVDFLDNANVTDRQVATNGTATVSIRCIDDDYVYIDGNTHQVVAVTATVNFAGETNEETMILLKDPPSSPGKGGSNAVTSLASFTSSTTPMVLGGSGANLTSDLGNSDLTVWMNSQGQMNGSMVINSSLAWQNMKYVTLNRGEGISVFGDFMKESSGNKIAINEMPVDIGTINTYKDMPYLFISGTMYLCGYSGSKDWMGTISYSGDKNSDADGVTVKLGNPTTGSMNVYCKNLYFRGMNGGSEIYADMYIFDENETSYIGRQSGGSTKLLNWANTVISPSKVQCGGNLLSNGDIVFDGEASFEKNVLVANDVTFTTRPNPYGGTSQCKVNVDGILSVGGSLTIENNAEVRCSKLEINDSDMLSINSGKLIINGIEYLPGTDFMEQYKAALDNPATKAAASGTILTQTITTFSDHTTLGGDSIDVVYPKEMTYNELIGLVKDPVTGADLGNDKDGDGVGDNKIALLPANSYGKFMDKKADGTLYYEPEFFKTWEDTVDKNGNAVSGMWTKFYDGVNESSASATATVYSCSEAASKPELPGGVNYILTGNRFNGKITFNVSKGQEIWVYLKDGLSLDGSGNIVVKGGGTVNFYTKKDLWLSSVHIATEYYEGLFSSGSCDIYKTPASDLEIPNIYIYSDYKEATTITLRNSGAYITGYVFAPTSKFISEAGGINKSVQYHDTDQIVNQNGSINLIGSLFVDDFQANNEAIFAHVSDAGLGVKGDDEATVWAMLSYTSGNGLG